MKVCYFGTYDNKPRNRIIIEGLRWHGVEVYECRVNIWKDIEDKSQIKSINLKLKISLRFIFGYIQLIFKSLRLGKYDAIIVGYPGYIDMFFAKPLSVIKKTPLIFDAFFSLYDTVVNDRKIAKKNSIRAKLCYFLDKVSCAKADKVLLDTKAHISYFHQTFGFDDNKFARIFVGAEESIFYPRKGDTRNKDDRFKVLFYGQFIPLHGIPFIVKAAKILEKEKNIEFTIIGMGQEHNRIKELSHRLKLSNINWVDWVNYSDLPRYIEISDICLGIFGTSNKANCVIPNKAFQALAMKKPLITGNTSASRELLTTGDNAILCERGNDEKLADAIMSLYKNDSLRSRIADSGYETFKEKCSIANIGRQVKEVVMELS